MLSLIALGLQFLKYSGQSCIPQTFGHPDAHPDISAARSDKRESSRPISAAPKSVQGQKEIGTALAALRKVWPTLCLRQRAWPGPRHKPFLHRRCQRHDIAEPHGNDH